VLLAALCRGHHARDRAGEPATTLSACWAASATRCGACAELVGGQSLRATRRRAGGHLSAAFFLVAAITPGSELLLAGANPTRTGVINILRAMGQQRSIRASPAASRSRFACAPLRGIEILLAGAARDR
jgi:5-enolpyruvylshikimate-3-phosphate synthase